MADEQSVTQGPAVGSPRRRGGRLRGGVALLVVLLIGCWAGGWFRAWSDRGLTAAQADQTTVRVALDGFSLGQSNGCDALGSNLVALQIPLHNYSPGPVVIRSITVDPPGQAPGAAQATGVTIASGGSAVVEVLIPIQLCTANQATSTKCPSTEAELDATAAVVPESGRVHDVRLPIGEWVPARYLQLYEDAPFVDWGLALPCP